MKEPDWILEETIVFAHKRLLEKDGESKELEIATYYGQPWPDPYIYSTTVRMLMFSVWPLPMPTG